MVISQFAALDLAESCGRIERPFRHVFAWLRGTRPQPALMLQAVPGSEILQGAGEGTGEERTAAAAAEDATGQS